jgi:hypothetical protein
MSKNHGLFGLFAAAAIFLGGCASGATAQGMTVKAADITGPASPDVAKSVAVREVEGGEATDAWGTSQIDNPEFKKALVRSLQAAGLLSTDPNPKYVVSADLVSLKQPFAAFNMTVTSRVRYTLKDAKSGAVIFSEEVAAQFTAKPSDSLIGVQRLRLANEGSARKSIAILIQKLNASGKSIGNAKPAGAAQLAATHTL